MLDTLQFDIRVSKRQPQLFYQGEPVGPVDAVIPRIGASITFYGLAVVRQFEMMGVYCLNESQAIARSRDKLRCLQILSRHEIGLPPTIYTRQAEHVPPASSRSRARRWWSSCWKARRASAWCWPRATRRPVRHRGVSRAGPEHPDPEIHQRGQRLGHPRVGGRPKGGGRDETAGGGGRVSLQPASRRHGRRRSASRPSTAKPPSAPPASSACAWPAWT